MKKTGTLSVDSGESRLDGTLLEIKGASDPTGDATAFLAGLGLGNGDHCTVTGTAGKDGNVDVIFLTNAGPPASATVKKASTKKMGTKKKAALRKSGD